jgi:hypothetical protein
MRTLRQRPPAVNPKKLIGSAKGPMSPQPDDKARKARWFSCFKVFPYLTVDALYFFVGKPATAF